MWCVSRDNRKRKWRRMWRKRRRRRRRRRRKMRWSRRRRRRKPVATVMIGYRFSRINTPQVKRVKTSEGTNVKLDSVEPNQVSFDDTNS